MKYLASCALAAGCATSTGTSVDLPLVSPPVRAATPAGFGGVAARTAPAGLDAVLSASDIRDRFFNPAGGPTEVFGILGSVDARIAEVNAAGDRPCLAQEPVAFMLGMFGEDVPFVAQCYRSFGASGFMMFGRANDETYLYVTGGAARLAARIAGAGDHVDTWYGVGYTNDSCGGFDHCSYAATRISATPATRGFEMTVAGIGVGFCGVQLASDGTTIYAEGSTDMGATCNAAATGCVDATSLADATGCATSFTLPPLGRRAGVSFGASAYPSDPDVTLDGTATDSLGFGPTAPLAGVGNFDAM